jgi:hypothetical protein
MAAYNRRKSSSLDVDASLLLAGWSRTDFVGAPETPVCFRGTSGLLLSPFLVLSKIRHSIVEEVAGYGSDELLIRVFNTSVHKFVEKGDRRFAKFLAIRNVWHSALRKVLNED